MSWIASVTLGLLFGACVSGRCSFATIRLPGVVPVALITSTAVSIVITPIVAWSLRTGVRNLQIYAPILWIALAIYDVTVVPRNAAYGLYGLFLLGLIGSIVLGLIPAAVNDIP
jgi:hypothetical protein